MLKGLYVVIVVNLLSNVYSEVDLWKGGKCVKIVYNPIVLQIQYVCTRCGEPLAVKRIRSNKASSDVNVVFNPSIGLPSEWDTSQGSINLSEELLAKLKRCMQQREFDKQV